MAVSEPVMRDDAAAESLRESLAERDAVALDGDVDVEVRLAHEHVSNGAADEVHAFEGPAHRLDGLEDRAQGLERVELLRDGLRLARRVLPVRFLERAEDIGARDDAGDLAARGRQARGRSFDAETRRMTSARGASSCT